MKFNKDFIRIITVRLLNSCQVTMADTVAAQGIFGSNVGSLRGKTKE
jgi:hypothetical protein